MHFTRGWWVAEPRCQNEPHVSQLFSAKCNSGKVSRPTITRRLPSVMAVRVLWAGRYVELYTVLFLMMVQLLRTHGAPHIVGLKCSLCFKVINQCEHWSNANRSPPHPPTDCTGIVVKGMVCSIGRGWAISQPNCLLVTHSCGYKYSTECKSVDELQVSLSALVTVSVFVWTGGSPIQLLCAAIPTKVCFPYTSY